MVNFKTTLDRVQELVKNNSLNNLNKFEVDFLNEKVYLINATSAFLKRLYQDNKICANLSDGKIQIQFFA
jgi:hypothetical protein